MDAPTVLPTFLLRCTYPGCRLTHEPFPVPSYWEAYMLGAGHEWVFNGSESFPQHKTVIDEVQG